MNNKVNYVLIGILVLIGLVLMSAFGFWLLKPSKESEVKNYAIYFNESVLGLNLDAPVKFRGVNVGKVVKLGIDEKDSDQVEVIIEVLNITPITTSTVAQLTSQGITGLSYINLTIDEYEDSKALVIKDGDKFPIIKSVPSLLIRLENTFGDIALGLADTLKRVQELLKKENQHDLSILLKNSAHVVSKINSMLDENTISDFKQSMKNINSASKQLDTMMPKVVGLIDKSAQWEDDIADTFRSIMNSYVGIKSSMDLFKESLQNGDFNLKEITSDLIPSINNTLFEMQQLIIKTQEAIHKYERSPRDMLLIQEKVKKAPGEN